MLSWILIVIGALWLLVILANKVMPYVQSKWPSAIPSSVATTVDKIDDYADMVAGIGACFAITAIAKKRCNADLATQVAAVRVTIAKLSDDSIS
jgi:hypothetical protein